MSRINVRPRNGRLQVSFYYDDPVSGKRRRFQRTSPHPQKRQSYDWGMAQLAELEAPPTPPERERLTLAQLWERYEQTALPRLKPSSQETHASAWRAHVGPDLGSTYIDQISQYRLELYATSCAAAGQSIAAQRRHIGLVIMLLRVAVRWGLLERAPSVTLPRPAAGHERWLTPDEARVLLAAAREDEHLSTIIPAILYTGMRAGEALALRWDCVDLERSQIEIRATLSAGQTTTPKGGRARRVPLSPEGRAVFKRCWDERQPGPLVWPYGGEQMQYQSLRWRWRCLVRDLGALEDLRMHDLRHTYASWLVQAGVSIQIVSQLLGHSTIQMTLKYAHLAPETLHSAVAQLDTFGDRLVTKSHLSVVKPA